MTWLHLMGVEQVPEFEMKTSNKAAFNPHNKKLVLKIILEKKAGAAASLKLIYRIDCKQ